MGQSLEKFRDVKLQQFRSDLSMENSHVSKWCFYLFTWHYLEWSFFPSPREFLLDWRLPIGFFSLVIPNQISRNLVIPMIIFGIPHPVYTFSPNSHPRFDFEFRIPNPVLWIRQNPASRRKRFEDPHSPLVSLQLADHLVEMLDSALAKYRTWLEKKSATRIASWRQTWLGEKRT